MNNAKIILIHGFCFSPELWHPDILEFINTRAELVNYCIPGFDPAKSDPKTLDDISFDIISEHIDYTRPTIVVGHSLGGYIALHVLKNDPNYRGGIILVNSHSKSDGEKRRISRRKQIDLIHRRGTRPYLRSFYSNMNIYDENLKEKFGMHHSKEVIAFYLNEMCTRIDLTEYLKIRDIQFGFIGGKNDNVIDHLKVRSITTELNTLQFILNNHGHLSPMYASNDIISMLSKMLDYKSFLLSK